MFQVAMVVDAKRGDLGGMLILNGCVLMKVIVFKRSFVVSVLKISNTGCSSCIWFVDSAALHDVCYLMQLLPK